MNFDGITLITEDVVTLTNLYEKILRTESERGDAHTEIET
jgi:hypothetical protein